MADTDHKDGETYSEAETVARREAALKRMLKTPHTPQRPLNRRREAPHRDHNHKA